MSLQKKFDALRSLATLLEKKEAVPDELWGEAGVKKNARLKDVQTEITATKKKVSLLQKEAHKSSSDDDDDMQQVEKKRQDTRVKKDVRRLGADKKNLQTAVAQGAFNMDREFA